MPSKRAPGCELCVLRSPNSPQEDRAVPALADPPQRPPAPAGTRGREQQVRVPGGAGAPQGAQVRIAVPGPVHLVPARPRAVRGGDLFDGVAGPRRLDVRELEVRGGSRAGQVPLWMSQPLAPDRREDERRRHARAEDGRGHVALRPVDEHPRDDPPAPKRSRIGACGLGASLRVEEVRPCPAVEHPSGSGLQLGEIGGDLRNLALGHSLEVDLRLIRVVGGGCSRVRLRELRGPWHRADGGERPGDEHGGCRPPSRPNRGTGDGCARTCARPLAQPSPGQRAPAELSVAPVPVPCERAVQFGQQRPHDTCHARLPVQGQPIEVRTADEHRVGAQRERLVGVHAGADAGIEQNGEPIADRLHDRGQGVERRYRAVDLAAAVIRDHDSVDAVLRRELRVPDALDSLQQDRAVPVPANQRQLLPAQSRVLEQRRKGDAGGHRVLGRRHGQAAVEDRVAGVVRDAEILEKR